MKTYKALFLGTVLSLMSGVTNAELLSQCDVEQMESLWSKSFAENDTGRLMTLYSEDALMFPPSSEILNGKSDIEKYLEDLKQVGVTEYDFSSINIDVKDGLVYETGLWEATRVDNEGNVIKLDGNITNVLEKQNDGSWKIKYQYWN